MNKFNQLVIAAASASMMVGGEYSRFALGALSMKRVCNRYPKRPGDENVEYRIDEKGNIRRSKRPAMKPIEGE